MRISIERFHFFLGYAIDRHRHLNTKQVRSVIPSPSLDDISRHLVAEQWRAGSNGSVAVPFGLPIARKRSEKEEEDAIPLQSKSFTTIDDFENVMKSQRSADASVRQRSDERRRKQTKSRTPPKLPARRDERAPTPRRGGVRLSERDAKTLARLSDESSTNEKKKNSRGAPPPIPDVKKTKNEEIDLMSGLFDNVSSSESTTKVSKTNDAIRITSLKYPSDEEDEEDDGMLTPEDSDIEEEEEQEVEITQEGIRIRLNHEKKKGKYVYDSISGLWYNINTKYFFNEKTKVYCKNPTDGPFFRYNREIKKLEKI